MSGIEIGIPPRPCGGSSNRTRRHRHAAGGRTPAAPVIDGLRAHYPYCTPEFGETRSPTSILSKVAPQAGGLIAASDLEPRHWGAWALFGEGAEAFTAASMHYRWPFPALPQFRQAQLFADFLDRFDRRRLIVAGDFNLTPWSFALRRQDARLGLRRRTRGLPDLAGGRDSTLADDVSLRLPAHRPHLCRSGLAHGQRCPRSAARVRPPAAGGRSEPPLARLGGADLHRDDLSRVTRGLALGECVDVLHT